MMIGGYLWGYLADQRGRRKVLVVSLAINGLFGGLASLAPWFWLFLLLRFISGIGYVCVALNMSDDVFLCRFNSNAWQKHRVQVIYLPQGRRLCPCYLLLLLRVHASPAQRRHDQLPGHLLDGRKHRGCRWERP